MNRAVLAFATAMAAAVLCMGMCMGAVHAATDGLPGRPVPSVRLLVAYCPTLFTSAGAIVDVDVTTGEATVRGTFKWPAAAMEGCVADYDPNVAVDGSTMWLNFVSDDGVFVKVDLDAAKVETSFSTSDIFFTGFEVFGEFGGGVLKGVSGTVTEHGLCNDGCYQYGTMSTLTKKYTAGQNILFKEMDDDVYHADDEYFYVQGGYDLRETKCAPQDSDECLLQLDIKTGELVKATFTNFTIYGYAGLDVEASAAAGASVVQTWMAGFSDACPTKDPLNPGYAFGTVNLATAQAEVTACLASNVTIDMDEWVGSFSSDGTLFSTGSGNAYGDPAQLLVLDTKTGAPVFSSSLASLPKKLGAAQDLIWIWSVTL